MDEQPYPIRYSTLTPSERGKKGGKRGRTTLSFPDAIAAATATTLFYLARRINDEMK